MKTAFQCVSEFQHQVLGHEPLERPQLMLSENKNILKIKIEEELQEFMDAKTIADQADALVDLIYFGLGGLYRLGANFDECFDIVHAANMTKVKGMTKRGVADDAAKPEEFKAPDLSFLDARANGLEE